MDYSARDRTLELLALVYALIPLLIAILPTSAARLLWLSSFWALALAMAYTGDTGQAHFTGVFLLIAGLWCSTVGWAILRIKSRRKNRKSS
jgi:hypothetical protein